MSNLRILYELTQDKSLIPNKVWKLWALECAKHVYPIFEAKYPEDKKVWDCLVRTEEYLNGKCSREELIKAKDAAYYGAAFAAAAHAAYVAYAAHAAYVAYAAYGAADAANDAYPAYAAAYGAAYAAVDAARAAENREEEENWQRNRLLELLDKGE